MAVFVVAVGNGARLARNYEKPALNEVRGTPKFISEKLAQELFANGQVYSQYCTEDGKPTMIEPENPNGSAFTIEGFTSPDGLVLGKMGHSERTVGIGGFNPDLIKNIACNKEASSCQNLFRAGARYFNS